MGNVAEGIQVVLLAFTLILHQGKDDPGVSLEAVQGPEQIIEKIHLIRRLFQVEKNLFHDRKMIVPFLLELLLHLLAKGGS